MKYIGISGYMHSGKDTFAGMLVERMRRFPAPGCSRLGAALFKGSRIDARIRAFAYPLKKLAVDIFGFTWEQMTDQRLKHEVDSFWGVTPREFLQMVGTEMFRDVFRRDVWIKVMEKYASSIPKAVIVIPDVRFPEEVDFICRDGVLIRVNRHGPAVGKDGAHESERHIPSFNPDFDIDNTKSIAELGRKADMVVEALFGR